MSSVSRSSGRRLRRRMSGVPGRLPGPASRGAVSSGRIIDGDLHLQRVLLNVRLRRGAQYFTFDDSGGRCCFNADRLPGLNQRHILQTHVSADLQHPWIVEAHDRITLLCRWSTEPTNPGCPAWPSGRGHARRRVPGRSCARRSNCRASTASCAARPGHGRLPESHPPRPVAVSPRSSIAAAMSRRPACAKATQPDVPATVFCACSSSSWQAPRHDCFEPPEQPTGNARSPAVCFLVTSCSAKVSAACAARSSKGNRVSSVSTSASDDSASATAACR